MSRSRRERIARETIEIVDRGWYEIAAVGRIDIGRLVEECVQTTKLFRPDDFKLLQVASISQTQETHFEVRNETTLQTARRLVCEQSKDKVLVLNLASAKNPGGGFLRGSQAQEESLARSSALYASLLTKPEYYEKNRECGTAMYTDHAILSPSVPVFRDDEGELLPNPYTVGILTAPAVNAAAVVDNEPDRVKQIPSTMASRIKNVLAVAAADEFAHLILGAWGCGVFGNDPELVAALFAEALQAGGSHEGVFASVTFAVLDRSPAGEIIRPFASRFGAALP